jgi:nucleotide-binding universal stress UspA family protein
MTGESQQKRATVLVATDLSTAADEAIRQGHEWASRTGAQLVVCHVVPAYYRVNALFPQRNLVDTVSTIDLERRVADLVATRVSEITGRAEDDATGKNVAAGVFRLVTDVGRPEAGILRAASAADVTMIVIGNRGDTGIERMLLGGVSKRVVRDAACSVLVARPAPMRGRVLVATDLSDPSLPAIIAGAAEARSRGAKLVVMHNLDFWPPPIGAAGMGLGSAGLIAPSIRDEGQLEQAMQMLREALARENIDAECKITTGPPDGSIVHMADEQSPELLVIGTHGRTGLSRLALGSVAERVVETANCSVLVVRLDVSPSS